MISALRARSLAVLMGFLGVVAASPRAAAQTAANAAAAQALFDQAKALMAAGKASEACPKFEESQRLDPGSGTLINLALCYEKTGRVASAWTTYRDAAAAAAVSGNTNRERGARARADELAKQVSKLRIDVAMEARVPGLLVTRDGVEVGPAQWGVPIPTDEGTRALVASAPGYREWRTKVDVTGAGATLTVRIPKLIEAPPATEASREDSSTKPPAPHVAELPNPLGEIEQNSGSGLGAQRIGAIVAGGVGVAGLAVGAVFGLQAMSNKEEADKTCRGTACTSDAGVNAGSDAHRAGNIATIGTIAGAVALAGGALLWFTSPASDRAPAVGLGPGGVTLRGAF